MQILTKDEKENLLNLCAEKWIQYCGVSRSYRTLYWDIALSVVADCEVFEEYIKSFPYGKESLNYDVTKCDIPCYKNAKNEEVKNLTQIDKEIFLKGYELLVLTIQ